MSLIEDYAMVGDLHTGALIGRDGAIDWLCLPHFDSAACFAALLDTPEAGQWRIAPAGATACARRRYREDTLILETEWESAQGHIRVIDFMPMRGNASDLVRIVEGISGSVNVHSELRLRFDYGRVIPWVRKHDRGLQAIAGPDAVWLHTPVPLVGQDHSTTADFTVNAGDRIPFVLTWSPSYHSEPARLDPERALAQTERFWQRWSERSAHIDGRWREAIRHSLLVLKALTFAPTGGIVAALTTSLPEQLGGPRNWDYRYCWLRDSTYTLQALLAAGYVTEAKAWREWLLRAVAGDPSQLQIMYGIDGRRRMAEIEMDWLGGYEGSKPVRLGNAAAGQLQLDVYGEVLDGLHLAREAGLGSRQEAWDVQVALLEYLEGAWQHPDNGLWEMRGPRQHFVHSKVMAWVAFDRMTRAARQHGLPGDSDRWQAQRDAIHAEVCQRGYDAERGTFVQAYGSQGLDASLLLIPRVGFLPGDDPRVVGTVQAVAKHLTQDGLVLRYHNAESGDGLPGDEGVFLACSFWLVDALHAIGQDKDAVTLYERLLDLRNDVGLLSEEWDPKLNRQLGNTPQAFSHFPLVVSGLQLHAREHSRSDQPVAKQEE